MKTLVERLDELKKDVGEAPADDAVPSEHRAFGFNAGVDACLPLLEEVLREELEAGRAQAHNTLARDIKAHLDELINSTK